VNAVQAVTFAEVLKVPAAQSVHCRSAVVDPGAPGEM
jgi:hypothetical protein